MDVAHPALICPACRSPLHHEHGEVLLCAEDGNEYRSTNGIWRMLTPEARKRLSSFIRSYHDVRIAEGRGSGDAEFYRSLPYPTGLDTKWTKHWQLRARSYESLLHNTLRQRAANDRLTILDLGAGNGWLSNRLGLLGHNVLAVDVQVNNFDGLGCHEHYESTWLPIQAEFDRLPIADRTADLVVFNASLHYSQDLPRTLAEARRVLKPNGSIVVLDSPFFNRDSAGRKMLLELPYDTDDQIGYLTGLRLSEAACGLGLATQFDFRRRTPREFASRVLRRLYLLREPAMMLPITLSPEAE